MLACAYSTSESPVVVGTDEHSFVDRDMFYRYLGLGVGHARNMPAVFLARVEPPVLEDDVEENSDDEQDVAQDGSEDSRREEEGSEDEEEVDSSGISSIVTACERRAGCTRGGPCWAEGLSLVWMKAVGAPADI